MKKPMRASLWLAASVTLATLASDVWAKNVFVPSSPLDRQVQAETEELVERLEAWLDRESPYPRRPSSAEIRLVTASQALHLQGQASLPGLVPRGLYDAETATIYLVAPWSPAVAEDASVLLHELAHHRQQTARHWYCPGAQELPAYRLQEKWLSERGLKARVNWIAVVLESGCSPRDIHPD